jgi:hypothetical protein
MLYSSQCCFAPCKRVTTVWRGREAEKKMEEQQVKTTVHRVVSTGRKNGQKTAEIVVKFEKKGYKPFYRTYHTIAIPIGYRYEKRDSAGKVVGMVTFS